MSTNTTPAAGELAGSPRLAEDLAALTRVLLAIDYASVALAAPTDNTTATATPVPADAPNAAPLPAAPATAATPRDPQPSVAPADEQSAATENPQTPQPGNRNDKRRQARALLDELSFLDD